jgi:isopentenyl phosphate kinase
VRGGTILSTEDLFSHLARQLHPQRLLLAGIEPGVWADYPACKRLMDEITPTSFLKEAANLAGSTATDVTGGMLAKVQEMVSLVKDIPGIQAWIFSGIDPGAVQKALCGEKIGTYVHNPSTD